MIKPLLSIPRSIRIPLEHRHLLWNAVRIEVAQKYAGSLIGRLWIGLKPLLFLCFYGLVFIFVYRTKPVDATPAEYVLHLFAGLIPFIGFSEGISIGALSLSQNRSILMNTVFPVELLPMRSIIGSQMPTVFGMLIAITFSIAIGKASWALLCFPVVLLCFLLFVIGCGSLLAPCVLVLRDIPEVLRFVIISCLVMSPIAYDYDKVSGALQILLYCNPVAYYIICLQEILVEGAWPPMDFFLGGIVIGLVTYGGGFAFLAHVRAALSDYAY